MAQTELKPNHQMVRVLINIKDPAIGHPQTLTFSLTFNELILQPSTHVHSSPAYTSIHNIIIPGELSVLGEEEEAPLIVTTRTGSGNWGCLFTS